MISPSDREAGVLALPDLRLGLIVLLVYTREDVGVTVKIYALEAGQHGRRSHPREFALGQQCHQ